MCVTASVAFAEKKTFRQLKITVAYNLSAVVLATICSLMQLSFITLIIAGFVDTRVSERQTS